MKEKYPHLVALLVALTYLMFFVRDEKYIMPINIKDLLIAAATIASIAVGFLATAKSTLLSINGSNVVRWMKDGGVYHVVIDYFMGAIHMCLLVAVFSTVMLVLDLGSKSSGNLYWMVVWLFLCVDSFFSCYRIIRLYSNILKKT